MQLLLLKKYSAEAVGYPSYNKIREAKKMGNPLDFAFTIIETEAKVNLQLLFDYKLKRI